MTDLQAKWRDIIFTLFDGEDEEDSIHLSEMAEDLARCVNAQDAALTGVDADRDFQLLAHRWFHTVGSPQLSFITSLQGLSPAEYGFAFHLAEDLFHIGYLAGVAQERGLVPDSDLDNIDGAAQCLAHKEGGAFNTITVLQQIGELPDFSAEDMAKVREAKERLATLLAGFQQAGFKVIQTNGDVGESEASA